MAASEPLTIEAAGEAHPVVYVQPRRAGRTVVLASVLVAVTGAAVWLLLGKPSTAHNSLAADAPAPAGAPLLAAGAAPKSEDGVGVAPQIAPGGEPKDVELKLEAEGDFSHVSFEALAAFDYDPYLVMETLQDGGKPPEQIPASVRGLNQRKLAIQGFMVPVQLVKERVKYFLLVRNQMLCCFGVAIGMNEWIYVTMDEKADARYVPDVPVVVYGTLHVGEEMRDGMVMSIYRMDGEKLVVRGGF